MIPDLFLPEIWKCQNCKAYYSAYRSTLSRCPYCRNVNTLVKEHFFSCPNIDDLIPGELLDENEKFLYLDGKCDIDIEIAIRDEIYRHSRNYLIKSQSGGFSAQQLQNIKRLFELLRSSTVRNPAFDLHMEVNLLREMGMFQQCINLINSIPLSQWSETVVINFYLSRDSNYFPCDKLPSKYQEDSLALRQKINEDFIYRTDLWKTELETISKKSNSEKLTEGFGCLCILAGIAVCITISIQTKWYYGILLGILIIVILGSLYEVIDSGKKRRIQNWHINNPKPKPPPILGGIIRS